MSSSRLRIAWFSDLSTESHRLPAYCSRLLVPLLQEAHDIELFSESTTSSELGLPHHHFLNAFRRHRERPFDIFFYQVEDSKSSRFARAHLGLIPGVAWLHDFFFNDLGSEALHTSPWETSLKQFRDDSVAFADRSVAPHQLWPRAYREASLSPIVLVSSRWALNEFSTMVSNRLERNVGEHHAEVLSVPVMSREVVPRKGEDLTRIACCSVTGIEGRAHKFLPALRNLKASWELVWMVDPHEQSAVLALAREFGVEDRVRIVGPRSVDVWTSLIDESDLAIHLHTSPFGHGSPFIQLTLMGACPAMVSFSGWGEDFPASAISQIVPGLHESAQILGFLEGVSRGSSRQFGEAGRVFVTGESEVKLVARTLSNRLVEWAPEVGYVMERWERLRRLGQSALIEEARTLVNIDSVPGILTFESAFRGPMAELGWTSS